MSDHDTQHERQEPARPFYSIGEWSGAKFHVFQIPTQRSNRPIYSILVKFTSGRRTTHRPLLKHDEGNDARG